MRGFGHGVRPRRSLREIAGLCLLTGYFLATVAEPAKASLTVETGTSTLDLIADPGSASHPEGKYIDATARIRVKTYSGLNLANVFVSLATPVDLSPTLTVSGSFSADPSGTGISVPSAGFSRDKKLGLPRIRDLLSVNRTDTFDFSHRFNTVYPGFNYAVTADGTVAYKTAWDKIILKIEGEVGSEAPILFFLSGLNPSGSVSAGLDIRLSPEDLLPRPQPFSISGFAYLKPCPPARPAFLGGECTVCPSATPVWNGSQCERCPAATPLWDAEHQMCVQGIPECPERQEWSASSEACICKDGFTRHETLDPDSSAPFDCLTQQELDALSGSGSGPGGGGPPASVSSGLLIRVNCTLASVNYTYWGSNGWVTSYGTPELHCFLEFYRYKEAPGPPQPIRQLCNVGLGWELCDDDPLPGTALPAIPPLDLEDYFGPCYEFLGVQVTPCATGSGPGPGSDRADLVIQSFGPLAVNSTVGDPMQLAFEVSNSGEQTAPNSRFEMVFDLPGGQQRVLSDWIGSLIPGASRRIVVSTGAAAMVPPYQAVVGSHQVSLNLDIDNDVDEGDETNNSEVRTVQVIAAGGGSGVDLRVTPISFAQSSPTAGGILEVSCQIENVGDTPAPATIYRTQIVHPDGTGSSSEVPMPSLAPGWSQVVALTLPTPGAGSYRVAVTADALDAVNESDEGNNLRERTVVVHPEQSCLPCTSGEPNNQLGDRLCLDSIDGIPNLGSLFTCRGVRGDGSTCVADGNHPNGWEETGSRCPDPATICAGLTRPDRCGNPGICPGSKICF